MTCLRIKNLNNDSLKYFEGPHGTICVEVDNPTFAATNWGDHIGIWNGGNGNFSTDCNYTDSCFGNLKAYNAKTYVPDDNFEAYLEANAMGDGIANNDSVFTSNINK